VLSQPFEMATSPPNLLCVSLNPAVDRRIRVPRLELRAVNRATSAEPTAGGKAAHVAYAAKALGADVTWLALTGGEEGEFCRRGVAARGVNTIAIPIAGCTRMTLELIDGSSGAITEVLEPGPMIAAAERDALAASFEQALSQKPQVVLSGSLPSGIPETFYAELISVAKRRGCNVFLDTSGAALATAFAARPSVIKPNRQELEALLGRRIASAEDAFAAADDLRSRGAEVVIVSLGADGAVLVSEGEGLRATAPNLRPISTVGSGDSFVAGWMVASAQGWSIEERLRLATACGAANCLASEPGVISMETVQRLSKEVEIRRR
jgi:1-phosphofructokinase family hexose kinase